MFRAVIVDDVAGARETLRQDLATYCPQVEIIGEADGVVKGAKVLRELKPDLVFLDVEMPDGSGFDLLEILNETPFRIIFTTGSDAHAIQAFRFSALDYLLKPIDPDDLMSAVEKLEEKPKEDKASLDLLKDQLNQKAPKRQRIALHTQDKIHIEPISKVVRCESNGNYTMFHFSERKKLLVTKTLKEFDGMLSEHGFLRVHQSHLINLSFLKEFVKIDGGYLVMNDGSNIPVSTRKRQMVIEAISKL